MPSLLSNEGTSTHRRHTLPNHHPLTIHWRLHVSFDAICPDLWSFPIQPHNLIPHRTVTEWTPKLNTCRDYELHTSSSAVGVVVRLLLNFWLRVWISGVGILVEAMGSANSPKRPECLWVPSSLLCDGHSGLFLYPAYRAELWCWPQG